MGFWRAIAKATLDKQAYAETERRQQAYNQAMGIGQYGGGPSIVGGWLANRRAMAEQQRISSVYNPLNVNYRPVSNTVSQMISSARGRCTCGNPDCGYNR